MSDSKILHKLIIFTNLLMMISIEAYVVIIRTDIFVDMEPIRKKIYFVAYFS